MLFPRARLSANMNFELFVIQMSFPTSKGGFKIIDTVLLGLIRLIIRRSKMPLLRQIFSSKFSSAVIEIIEKHFVVITAT